MTEQNKFLRELKDALSQLNSVNDSGRSSETDPDVDKGSSVNLNTVNSITRLKKTAIDIAPGTVCCASAKITPGGISETHPSSGRVCVPPIFVQTASSCTSSNLTPQELSPAKTAALSSPGTSSSDVFSPLSEEHVISPSSVLFVTKYQASVSKKNVTQIRNSYTSNSIEGAHNVVLSPIHMKKGTGMIKNRRMRAVHADLYRELNNVLLRRTEKVECCIPISERRLPVDNISHSTVYQSIPMNHYQSVSLPVPLLHETDNEYISIDVLEKYDHSTRNNFILPRSHIPTPTPLSRHFNFKSMPQLNTTVNEVFDKPVACSGIYHKHKRTKSENYTKSNATHLSALYTSPSKSHLYEEQEQIWHLHDKDDLHIGNEHYTSSVGGNQNSMYSLNKSPLFRNNTELSSASFNIYGCGNCDFRDPVTPSPPALIATELSQRLLGLRLCDSGSAESTGCLTPSDIGSGRIIDEPSSVSAVKYILPNTNGIGYLKPNPYPHTSTVHNDISLTPMPSSDNSVNEETTTNSTELCSSFEHLPLNRGNIQEQFIIWQSGQDDNVDQAKIHVLSGTSCRNVSSFAGVSTLEGQQKWMQENAPMFVKVIPSVPDLKLVKNTNDFEVSKNNPPNDVGTYSLDRHLKTTEKLQFHDNPENKFYATYPLPKSGRQPSVDENVMKSLLIQHSGERIPPDGAESFSSLHRNLGEHYVGHTLTVPQPTSFHSYGSSQLVTEPPHDWNKSGSCYNLCGKPTSVCDFTVRAVYEHSQLNNKHTYYTGAMTNGASKDADRFDRNGYLHSDSSSELDIVPFFRAVSASTQEPTDDSSTHETSSPDERKGLFRKKLSSASEKENQRHLLYHTWSSVAAKRQQKKSIRLKVPSWKRFGRQSKTGDDSDSSSSFVRGIKPRLMRNSSNCSSSAVRSLHGESGVYKKCDSSQSVHTSHASTHNVHTHVPGAQDHPSDADTESLNQDLDTYERSLFQYVRRTADMSQRSADIRSLYWKQLDAVSCKTGHRGRRSGHNGNLLHRLVCCFLCPGHPHSNATMSAARTVQQQKQYQNKQHFPQHRHTYAAPNGNEIIIEICEMVITIYHQT